MRKAKHWSIKPKESLPPQKERLTSGDINAQIDEFFAKGGKVDVAELPHTERKAYPARFSEG